MTRIGTHFSISARMKIFGSNKFILWMIPVLLVLGAGACLVKSVCYQDADCPPDQVCEIGPGEFLGACRSPCSGDDDCLQGSICDQASGKCIEAECRLDADCPDGFECKQGRCIYTEVLECAQDMVPIENRFCIDIYEASRPDATGQSQGSDGSKATSRAGVIPWRVVDNAEAQAACQAAGKTLCTESQWFLACRGPEGTVYGYGDPYDPVICNGIDTYCRCGPGSGCEDRDPCPFPHCYHTCSAAFRLDPTGANAGCTNAYGVFDMNGNLWEHVLGGDETRIRGGAYNCSDSETLHRCDYIPGVWKPSARGFRCCSTGIESGN